MDPIPLQPAPVEVPDLPAENLSPVPSTALTEPGPEGLLFSALCLLSSAAVYLTVLLTHRPA